MGKALWPLLESGRSVKRGRPLGHEAWPLKASHCLSLLHRALLGVGQQRPVARGEPVPQTRGSVTPGLAGDDLKLESAGDLVLEAGSACLERLSAPGVRVGPAGLSFPRSTLQ